MIRVLIADDHSLVRAGLKAILAGRADIQVIGEAADGLEALANIQRLTPDVVMMDISMPGLNGLDTLKTMRDTAPTTQVIVISMHRNEEYVIRAYQMGAKSYLFKDAPPEHLFAAVDAAARGEHYYSPPYTRERLKEYMPRTGAYVPAVDRLTARERQVLQLIAEGLTTQQTALRLNISVKTVEAHRSNLMTKLDLHDIASLTRLAIRVGLIDFNA